MVTTPKEPAEKFSFQLDEFYLDLQKDGNKISILDKEKIEERPFPGLRPFKTSEFQLFKGRDGQAEELLKRLKKNHFLAVIGSSGTGKSSLVRAGLIPQLFGGYLQEVGNKWNIAICRPGKDPVENLAVALSSIKGHSKDKSHIIDNYGSIGPQLNSSIYGILEVDELLHADKPKEQKPNLLIIVDQFEELFRFNRKDLGKGNIENHFVNLLLKASLNISSSVYVIITMRSEFLGDCVKYRGLPEAINEGQYLVPQLTRNQLKEVIEGPINLAGKTISPGLVELLINEIEESKLKENLDQLPILQHALMRTYREAMKHGPDTEISFEHYKEIGEMDKALADHAQAKLMELGGNNQDGNLSKKQKIAKVIFQALTDASTDQKGGRRPTELKNIYSIAKSVNAGTDEVNEVINHFRDIDTSFIMPPINPDLPNTGLYPDLIMDISHESLMRNWDELKTWITEEVRYGKLYKTLNARRELNEQDKSELVRGVLLKELIDWKTNYTNNVTWASRYHSISKSTNDISIHEDLYRKNLQFLAESEAASEEAKEAEQKKLKEEIERTQKEKSRKKLMRVFAAAAIISLCFGLWAFTERANAAKSAADALKKERVVREQSTLLARAAEKEARTREQLALQSEKYARQRTDSALLFAERLQVLKERAELSAKEARQQKAIADELTRQAKGQSTNLEMQLVKGELQKQKFYSSNVLSTTDRDFIVNTLFYNPLTDPPVIPFKKYVDPELLNDVNTAIEAREKILYEPVEGLRKADTMWKDITNHDKNGIIKKIFLDIFNKNIFPAQNIELSFNDGFLSNESSLLTVSKDSSHFAFNNVDNIITGAYNQNEDNLTLNEDVFKITRKIDNPDFGANVVALSYPNNEKIISLQDNGKIIKWNSDGTQQLIDSLAGVENSIVSEFSHDGTQLISISKDGAMKLQSIGDKIRTMRDKISSKLEVSSTVIDSALQNRNISQIFFSPNNKMIIRIFRSSGFDVWNLLRKQRVASFNFYRSPSYRTANFTPDGNYILASSAGNTIMLLDSLGKRIDYFSLSALAGEGYVSSIVNNLSLSPDWDKLMVRQGTNNFVYENPVINDSIFHLKKMVRRTSLTIKKLNGSNEGTLKALFLNENRIMSIDKSGHIYLWKTDEDLTNLDDAFTSIKKVIAPTYKEKLESGQIGFDQVLADSNKNNLRVAALYYSNKDVDGSRQKQDLEKALILFKKLSNTETGDLRKSDLNKTIGLLEDINTLAKINRKQNCYSILDRLKEIVAILESEKIGDSTTLAKNYNSLSYYSLYAENFSDAIKYALEGLKKDSSYNVLYTNLALGYLLSGQDKLAEDIYMKYKDEDMNYDGRSFKEGFSIDFTDFTNVGVISPDDKRVLRIKKMLDNK